jgi:hypothetical protein
MSLRPPPLALRPMHAALVLGLIAPFLLALSTRSEDEVPETELNFAAEIVDISGAKTVGDRISVEGVTYFTVRRGMTTIFVPFAKLRALEVTGPVATEGGVDRLPARFDFADGTSESGSLRARDQLIGASSLGTFELRLRDLRTLRFVGSTPVAPPRAR